MGEAVEQLDDLLTAKEVARLVRVDVWTFYRWLRRGIGPRALRVGGIVRFRRADVDCWMTTEHVAKRRKKGPTT